MAERRMFAKTIIDSDAFLDMPLSTQALYFHLSMHADDDGFINNPKKIQRMVCASDDDAKVLIAKRFIIPFESGIVVIKHWKIHNYIQKDRYKPTVYQEEKALLTEKKNQGYTLSTQCIQNVSNLDTQDRLGKDRIGKVRSGKESVGEADTPPANLPHLYGEYKNVYLTPEDLSALKAKLPDVWKEYIERLSSYMAKTGKTYDNHRAVIESWAKEDAQKKMQQPAGNSQQAPCSNPFLRRVKQGAIE